MPRIKKTILKRAPITEFKKLICLIFFTLYFTTGLQAQGIKERQTTACNMRMTVNNLGNIGNSFKGSFDDINLRYGSCRYPADSKVEHLFEGGLWIGAIVGDKTIVSTSSVEAASGFQLGGSGFEFTAPIESNIIERTSRTDNPQNYSPQAVSHQDFISDCTDKNIKVPGTDIFIPNLESGPLGVDLHFEAYNWDYSFTNFFVILNYTVKNTSDKTWKDVYIGPWVDPVIRNIQRTPAGSGGTSFFNKGGSGYIDTVNIAYEFDAIGDPGFTDSYLGVKFLGSEYNQKFYHPKLDTAFKVNFNAWQFRDFSSAYRSPQNDNERYDRLKTGQNYSSNWPTFQPQLSKPGNRSFLLSCGPFKEVKPGEQINITFAVICADKFDDGRATAEDTPEQKKNLIKNGEWAQSAYNGEDRNFDGIFDVATEDNNKDGKLTRYVLPEPPPPPIDTLIITENTISLYWADNAEKFIDPVSRTKDFEGYRIYKTPAGFDLKTNLNVLNDLQLIAQYDANIHSGFKDTRIVEADNGFDAIKLDPPVKFPGNPIEYRYKYDITNLLNGWQHGVVITAFDRGQVENNLGPLESSPLTRLRRAFPGKPANPNFEFGEPFVYPNPYYAGAAWEGSSKAEEDRRIIFSNLPRRAEVNIYTSAGDLVYSFRHEGVDSPKDTRWLDTQSPISEQQKRYFSGGEHSWNLLSNDSQIIARGLYVFTVKDLDSGESKNGKFAIIR